VGESFVFSQAFDQAAVRGPDDPDAAEEEKQDDDGDDYSNVCGHETLLFLDL
jgi:hypothetical protein